ncbi:hypothetical protein, variant [Aphanomyces invadans]|uniref:RING-type domain-containing protein n=1 Tax=Aphanomyces invadans TaxID=157072 RepID=A0A024UEJ7_9STRA|nr:hypothetical protein, variant [Aphanomyces invadans]ETW04821.1 hypothetical protein, variant [Aphanomyces invadans]|eukprot:XP_008866258.1 hypothetical protein, variant [Aphanomyces invadans]
MADVAVDLCEESEDDDNMENFDLPVDVAEEKIGGEDEEKREVPLDDSDEEECCCICIENIESVDTQGFLLKCVHSFHFDCIAQWAKVTNLCPMCKTRFREIVRRDGSGAHVATIKVKDAKQSHANHPSQDIQANGNLFNEYACTLCGNGDNEDVLLICDVDGCEHAAHTYCVPLPAVPAGYWHCSDHVHVTPSRRRRTGLATTLATLRSSSSRRRSAPLPTRRISQLEARLGIRRGQRVALPFENEVLRYTGGASVTQTTPSSRRRRPPQVASAAVTDMRRMQGEAARILQIVSHSNHELLSRPAARRARGANANATQCVGRHDASDEENVREAFLERRKRRIEDIQAILQRSTGAPVTSRQRLNSLSFQDEYNGLRDKMAHAHVLDTSTPVPTAAKLRLVPVVKRFFDPLTPSQQNQVLDWGVLSALKRWVEPIGRDQKLQHPQVINAILKVLGALPITYDRLNESEGLIPVLTALAASDQLDMMNKNAATSLLSRWRALTGPPTAAAPAPTGEREESKPRPPQLRAMAEAAQLTRELPTAGRLAAATQVTSVASLRSEPTLSGTVARRPSLDPLPTKPRVVEHIKSQLYPAYRRGLITKDRFKWVAQHVCQTFMYEASHMSSAVLARDGSLSALAKKRLNDLIDVATTT